MPAWPRRALSQAILAILHAAIPVRQIEYRFGPPDVRWLMAAPDVRWATADPEARWITDQPAARWIAAEPESRWLFEEMTMAEISSLSVEAVKVRVIFTKNGVVQDPTADPVSLAFLPDGTDPAGGDWVTGSWEKAGTDYWAVAVVGPGVHALAKARYMVWVKVTDNPDVPVKRCGFLQVT